MDFKRASKIYEKEACNLIKAVTGIQEEEENFKLCYDYVLSNFLYHQFLDVDSFKVRRSIDGLCEKFTLHGDIRRARALKNVSKKFLDILTEKPVALQNAGYGVLSLLISLAGTGENEEVSVTPEENSSSTDNEKEEKFDWAKYLLEGEKKSDHLSEDDSSFSEWDDDDSLEDDCYLFKRTTSGIDSGIDVSPSSCCSSSVPPVLPLFRPYEEPKPKKAFPKRRRYWEPLHQRTSLQTQSKNFHANFTQHWENFLYEKDPIYTPETNVVLTEDVVLREILWMLHGIQGLYLFPWKNDQFEVLRNVHMTHLTEHTLHKLLLLFCPYGNKIIELKSFLRDTVKMSKNLSYNCQVLQAYADGLQHHLQKYFEFLTSCEKQIIDHKKISTIIELLVKLEPHFNNLELIYEVHKKTIKEIPPDCQSWECSLILLNSLWNQLNEYSIWATEKSMMQIILSLFLTSLRPYLNIIESLVMRGKLTDPYEEFFLQRNYEIDILNENFCYNGFSYRKSSPNIKTEFFLKSHFDNILLAGKSMELLERFTSLTGKKFQSDHLYDYLYCMIIIAFRGNYRYLTENYETVNKEVDKNYVNELVNKSESNANVVLPEKTSDSKIVHTEEKLKTVNESIDEKVIKTDEIAHVNSNGKNQIIEEEVLHKENNDNESVEEEIKCVITNVIEKVEHNASLHMNNEQIDKDTDMQEKEKNIVISDNSSHCEITSSVTVIKTELPATQDSDFNCCELENCTNELDNKKQVDINEIQKNTFSDSEKVDRLDVNQDDIEAEISVNKTERFEFYSLKNLVEKLIKVKMKELREKKNVNISRNESEVEKHSDSCINKLESIKSEKILEEKPSFDVNVNIIEENFDFKIPETKVNLNMYKDTCLKIDIHQNLIEETVDIIQPEALVSVILVVEEAVNLCIEKACTYASESFVKILKIDHNLMLHLSVMKKYFLMDSGAVLFSFYTGIFRKIFFGRNWQDISFIHNALQNAVSAEDSEIAEKLSLQFDENCQDNKNQPLNVLAALRLSYQVGWPINIILSSESQNKYCSVFCFLLQIKCAKHILDELIGYELCENKTKVQSKIELLMKKLEIAEKQKIHGMYIMRMRLLHFINGFHTYIMTKILHSSGLELNEKLKKAKNLDDILLTHQQYLSSLHERCLLDSKLPYLKEQIIRILNLALRFQRLWMLNMEQVNLEDLRSIEQEFSSCINFLKSYLNKPLKRGVNVHFEALASAIISPSHLQRVFS